MIVNDVGTKVLHQLDLDTEFRRVQIILKRLTASLLFTLSRPPLTSVLNTLRFQSQQLVHTVTLSQSAKETQYVG